MITNKVTTNTVELHNIKTGECCQIADTGFYMVCTGHAEKLTPENDCALLAHLESGTLVNVKKTTQVLPLVGSVQLR